VCHAGSSIIAKLSKYLLLHAIKICGLTLIKDIVVMPLATGMSLMMCMSAMLSRKPAAKYVIFTRIDQKSCFKSILTCNLTPLIVDGLVSGDEVITNIDGIESLMKEHGEEILCVLSTTR
jgi:O-phospho-L-seryl-tRNASec:L-selenocysteinyl-tRNA synthase